MDEQWRERAACRNKPTWWWFDSHYLNAKDTKALAICATCPVRTQCLTWALQFPPNELHGIWGGTSQRERARIYKRLQEAPTCLTIRPTGRLSGITLRRR